MISGQSMTVSSRNKPVNTVLQAQIAVSQVKYCYSVITIVEVCGKSVNFLIGCISVVYHFCSNIQPHPQLSTAEK